ncbi:RHS repeat-associated core domain-containing protein [Chryseobacterium sp. MYb328]|uniref:RHS repeat-associated core domain-containing protein n=1 Tax=Chryseobacterium sp. MYb328 TaxID=2745231 RepID=UPI0030B177AA
MFPGKNVKPKYNGNIAEVDWRAVESLGANPSTTPKRYGYVYDSLNRLTAGYYQNPMNAGSKENTESLSYDLNGNITNLYRTSVIENLNTATVIDNLEYTYLGNQAIRIKDHSNNKSGYEGTKGSPIDYDLNGNMTKMFDKNITDIGYNYLNLPNGIMIGSDQVNTTIDTKYNAEGTKLRKEYKNTSIGISNTTWTKEITDYLDGFQYVNRTSSDGGGDMEFFSIPLETNFAYEQQAFSNELVDITRGALNLQHPELQFFPTAEGYYDYQRKQYIYQYKDHLGNTRISFGRNSIGALEITDANDYYPFGMNHLKTGNAFFGKGSYKNYKYNGKELQETGMYDYGARMYMPDLGRWGVVDPLAETSRRFSTYTYAFNNPIRFIDPDGMQNQDIIKIFNNGNIERTKDDNAYDTITNEDGSKSIQIARTNVTEANPTGDSQVGEAKDINFKTPGHEGSKGSNIYTYLQIQNDDAAKQFFDFAAENTSVEFTRDTFSFGDGFSSNVITTSHVTNVSVSAYFAIPYVNLTGGNGNHFINQTKSVDFDHSHPLGESIAPGGFNFRFDKNNSPIFYKIITGGYVDADVSSKNPIFKTTNVYSTWKWPTPGKGYVNFNGSTATYTGSNRKIN